MKLLPLKSSLIALALFTAAGSGTALAATNAEPGTMILAQADDASTAGSQRIENIKKFLARGRDLSKLDDAKLQQRLKRATKMQATPDLPEDLAQGLVQEIAELNDELARRQSGSASGNAPATAETDTQSGDQQQAEDTSSDNQADAPAASSAEVADFLSSVQPVDSLDKKALRTQMRKAAQLSRTAGISAGDRKKLRQIVRDSRAALGKGESGNTQASDTAASTGGNSKPAEPADASGKSADAQAPDSGAAAAFIAAAAPAANLKDGELRKQLREAARLAKTDGVSKGDRQRLRQIVGEARAELDKRKAGNGADTSVDDASNSGNQQPPAKPAGNGQAQPEPGKIAVDVVSEQKAREILNDQADARTMNKADLRKRLATMRELLAANKLSPETNKALRQKLATERAFLRQAVDQGTQNAGQGGDNSTTNVTINNDVTINQNVVKVVIADRRPSADLKDDELRVRINVYRKIVVDVNYPDSDRQRWRTVMDRDRVILRQRMLAARSQRANQLKAKDISIDLSLDFKPGRPVPPRAVFAAEADDQEITDVLSAAPRRKLDRKYTVEEVETDPQLRDAVARIEIDTVHFGFGEGFLREEEIDNLDRIAEIMEKILAVNPGEVFMVEGHTDAVGSDPSNLDLSRERAKAVKQALSTYYVIPADNLKTVGFGERYLKIPTSEAEAENRRVSIARITPLVGALGQ